MTPEPTPEDLAGWCERYAAIQAAYPVDAERLRLSAAALRSHAGLASRIAAITEAGIAAGYDIRHGNDRGGLTEVGLVQKILADLVAARSEVARLRTERDAAYGWCADQLVVIADVCEGVEKDRYGRLAERLRKGPAPREDHHA